MSVFKVSYTIGSVPVTRYWKSQSRGLVDDIMMPSLVVEEVEELPQGWVKDRIVSPGVVAYALNSNARHQQEFRARRSRSGKKEVRVWVPEGDVETVKEFCRNLPGGLG